MSTSDSVDRVFVHALATVRRLPRTGSSRPPPSARLRLYGLYKQSMEGDVESILPRPTLPPPSPTATPNNDPSSSPEQPRPSASQHRDSQGHHTVHRYASRDLRTREAQAEIEKWDAWHACAGMTRTEAKRRYIEALIETMKEYASGTQESRELVGELEFVWGQIRSQSSGSGSGSGSDGNEAAGSGSRRSGGRSSNTGGGKSKSATANKTADADKQKKEDFDGESPRRSGLKGLGSDIAPSSTSRRFPPIDADGRRMRMLSPMSPREGSDIVEGREARDLPPDDDDEEVDDAAANPPSHNNGNNNNPSANATAAAARFASLEAQLRRLATEVAALREQLSANHLLSSSSYSLSHSHAQRSMGLSPYQYAQLSRPWKAYYRALASLRALLWFCVRQAVVGVLVLGAVVLWGRSRGDRRAEEWARRRGKEVRGWVLWWGGKVWEGDEAGWWVGLGWLVRVVRWRGRGLLGVS